MAGQLRQLPTKTPPVHHAQTPQLLFLTSQQFWFLKHLHSKVLLFWLLSQWVYSSDLVLVENQRKADLINTNNNSSRLSLCRH